MSCVKQLTAAIIISNKQLLCVHNTKHGSLRVEPPGGKKEPDETLEACIDREIREELGCDCIIEGLFFVTMTDTPEGSFSVHMFTCKLVGVPTNVEKKKHKTIEWCSFSQLEKYSSDGVLVPNLREVLPRLKEVLL